MVPLLIAAGITGLGYLLIHSIFSPDGAAASSTATDDLAPLRRQALGMLKYVNGGGRDRARISAYQRTLGVSPSGVPDNASELRIEELLGYDVSWTPIGKRVAARTVKAQAASSPPPKPKTAPSPSAKGPLAQIVEQLATAKPVAKPSSVARPALKPPTKAPVSRSAAAPRALPASVPSSTPTEAARELDSYLVGGGLNVARIRELQSRIGGISADGIAGAKTRARVTELLGREVVWPSISAATLLRVLVAKGGATKPAVADKQRKMGVDADGIVGPKTKARYVALTGRAW